MFLRSLEVRNFRGIVSGRLDLDETTVLIGENDCGKSSLLSALAVVLASGEDERPLIERHHFHRPLDPAAPLQGPVHIELTFEERAPGEWSEALLGALAALLPEASNATRQLVVSVQAEAPAQGAAVTAHWTIAAPGGKGPGSRDVVEHLGIVRRLCPLVWLQAGMLLGATAAPGRPEGTAPGTGRFAELAAEVESRYQSLLTGTSSNELAELKAGYEAARELLRQRAEEYHSAGSLSHAPVAEVLGTRAGAHKSEGRQFL